MWRWVRITYVIRMGMSKADSRFVIGDMLIGVESVVVEVVEAIPQEGEHVNQAGNHHMAGAYGTQRLHVFFDIDLG